MTAFHNVSLPLEFSLGATGGPHWRTDVVELASGGEYRNSQWSAPKRRWDVGGAVKSLEDLSALTAFFNARRGRLHGFRFKDVSDFSSAALSEPVSPLNEPLGVGDGERTNFQLIKTDYSGEQSFQRRITKPVSGTVRVGIDGQEQTSNWSIDHMTGIISFSTAPEESAIITAGYEFDTAVRFDTDRLEIAMDSIGAGRLLSAPIVELLD